MKNNFLFWTKICSSKRRSNRLVSSRRRFKINFEEILKHFFWRLKPKNNSRFLSDSLWHEVGYFDIRARVGSVVEGGPHIFKVESSINPYLCVCCFMCLPLWLFVFPICLSLSMFFDLLPVSVFINIFACLHIRSLVCFLSLSNAFCTFQSDVEQSLKQFEWFQFCFPTRCCSKWNSG